MNEELRMTCLENSNRTSNTLVLVTRVNIIAPKDERS